MINDRLLFAHRYAWNLSYYPLKRFGVGSLKSPSKRLGVGSRKLPSKTPRRGVSQTAL
jgi:hypothetical protein